jgi:hypothetical protein
MPTPSKDNSAKALRELVRVLEEAVQAGVHSVGLEYKDGELMVFHNFGNVAFGASRIAEDLRQGVIDVLVKGAGLSRKSRGKMQIRLLDKDFDAVAERYESFGERAYNLTLKERTKKTGR